MNNWLRISVILICGMVFSGLVLFFYFIFVSR